MGEASLTDLQSEDSLFPGDQASYSVGTCSEEGFTRSEEDETNNGDNILSRTYSTVTAITHGTINSVFAVSSYFWGETPTEAETTQPKNDEKEPIMKRPSPYRKGERRSRRSIDFLKDPKSQMTWSRRIALANMSKNWYNPLAHGQDLTHESSFQHSERETRPPKVTKKQTPSLAKAWAYYEHFAMPRYLVEEDHNRFDLSKADPGESEIPTKLYSPLFTPLSQMGDFGLGIGIYFSTLRAIAILTLLAGILNIPNFIYFSSDKYSNGQPDVPDLIRGSAICTRTEWVPCIDCNPANFQSERLFNLTITDTNDDGNNNNNNNMMIPLALRNNCDGATLQEGLVNYATILLVLIGIGVMTVYQRRKEIEFDEDEQTAQDYSIRIRNPPPDATDPEEWRTFFRQNFDGAHATVVTVALDNDSLVRALKARRECLRKIELGLQPGTSLDFLTLSRLSAEIEQQRGVIGKVLALVSPGIPELFGRMAMLEARIKGWAQVDYPCSNVFVTFETEADQRRILSILSLGSLDVKRNVTEKLNAKYLFRGNLVLRVNEPDEPNTIRWGEINIKFWQRLKPLATTTIFAAVFIVLIALLIRVINSVNTTFAAIAISIFNAVFPEVAKFLTSFELHPSEGLKQTSLYFKIAAFRWVNTAIVITLITPFTATLSNHGGVIRAIYAIFFAEIVTTNAIQLLDIPGQLKRHILAPRAVTQDAMNLQMQGSEVELAERYTNMTKILFLAVWYCSIYPGAMFMCSFALFVNYFTDRFSLMRSWKRLPYLGTRISRFSSRYFFSSALVVMAIVSSYYWSGFPYDNLCLDESAAVPRLFFGQHSFQDPSEGGRLANITINDTSQAYRYCLQNIHEFEIPNFPALPRWQPEGKEWMTDEQELVVSIFGWSTVGVIGIVLLSFVWMMYGSIVGMFKPQYKPRGHDMGIAFSEVMSISSYVPQVESNVFSYPLLACSIKGIDPDLFDWTDPDRDWSYYDLTQDADELIEELSINDKVVFSILSHCPPPGKSNY